MSINWGTAFLLAVVFSFVSFAIIFVGVFIDSSFITLIGVIGIIVFSIIGFLGVTFMELD